MLFLFLGILLLACGGISETNDNITIEKITVNYLENPLGIDDLKPCLTWIMSSEERTGNNPHIKSRLAIRRKPLTEMTIFYGIRLNRFWIKNPKCATLAAN